MVDNGLYYLKKDMGENMDNLVLDAINKSDFEDFKEYQEEMESFKFSDIFG